MNEPGCTRTQGGAGPSSPSTLPSTPREPIALVYKLAHLILYVGPSIEVSEKPLIYGDSRFPNSLQVNPLGAISVERGG